MSGASLNVMLACPQHQSEMGLFGQQRRDSLEGTSDSLPDAVHTVSKIQNNIGRPSSVDRRFLKDLTVIWSAFNLLGFSRSMMRPVIVASKL